MKNTFKGFYLPNENELEAAWNSSSTLFVFDTNVFLNLYGYADQTRNDFFELLDVLKSQIWMPYHVGLEYQRRRLEVIRNEKEVFVKIETYLNKIEKIITQELGELHLEKKLPRLNENTEKFKKEIQTSISNFKKSVTSWDNKQPCVRTHDKIREKLNSLFDGKVGDKPENQKWLDDLSKSGSERYKNKVPPGFKDDVKSKSDDNIYYYDGLKYERQFGDLIVWFQILEKSKDTNVSNVIFVTDDSKEDWWYTIDSRGKKQIGPHAYLQSEIYGHSNINLFYMYNTSMFLEYGKKYRSICINSSSIDETLNHWQSNKDYNRDVVNKTDFTFSKYLNLFNDDIKLEKTFDINEVISMAEKLREYEERKKQRETFRSFFKNSRIIDFDKNEYKEDKDGGE